MTKPSTPITMDSRDKYEYIRLDTADNGWILCWEEYKPALKNDQSYYDYHKEIYSLGDLKKAVDKMLELQMENLIARKSKENPDQYAEAIAAYEEYTGAAAA
jgi:hypothetical protein